MTLTVLNISSEGFGEQSCSELVLEHSRLKALLLVAEKQSKRRQGEEAFVGAKLKKRINKKISSHARVKPFRKQWW